MKFLPKKRFKLNIKDTYLEGLLPRFKEERISAFLTIAATLLAVSIFGFFAINPTLVTIAQLRKQLADSKFVDQKLVEKIANVSALQQSYVQIQNNLPTILTAIPTNPDIPKLIAQIQAIGQTTQVQVSRIQTLPVELSPNAPTTGYVAFLYTVDAKGTITAITNFITLLQSSDRLMTTDGLSLSRSSDPSLMQVSFKGKAYFKKS